MRADALLALLLGAAVVATVAVLACTGAGPPPAVSTGPATRFAAAEARQGVAVDASNFYAVDNSRIGKYDLCTGGEVAR